jgi:glucose-6-phosphate 1-dehydrogenase
MDQPTTLSAAEQPVRMSPGANRLEDAAILILGASGDLTARKLIPALFALRRNGYLSERSPVIGVARRGMSDDDFRREMQQAITEGGDPPDGEAWEGFARQLFYRRADLTRPQDFRELDEAVSDIERQRGIGSRRVVYLATAPELFLPSVEGLSAAGMVPDPEAADRWLRVVIEKPFGHDLARSSSRCLTATTWTTCRSPWPSRRGSNAAAAPTTIKPGPCGTCCRITSCSSWR